MVAKGGVTPRGVARFLVIVVLSLTALSLIGQAAKHFLPDFVLRDRFAEIFDVDQEGNIPTLYSALAIHEEINPRLNLSDFTQFSAAALGGVFVVVFAVVLFPLLLQLPPPLRRLFVLAGLTFLGGAITQGGRQVLLALELRAHPERAGT